MAASATRRRPGWSGSRSTTDRIDDAPRTYSGGMRQRLQIARNLVTEPRLVFMDEPTGGLDVSVQARLLDLMRGLVSELGLAAIVVTHDLAVARLLSHRMMVMKGGRVIETGLTDQVLDDPARALHAAARLLDFAGMSDDNDRDDRTQRRPEELHHASAGRHRAAGGARRLVSRSSPANASCSAGPSGAGKSSILKMIFGNYRCDGGRIGIRHQGELIDLATAEPRAGARRAPLHHRLCQPVPARGAARRGASTWSPSR